MDLFKQSTEQAREAFTSMPMQSRVITVLLIAAIALGLGFLVRGSDADGKVMMFGGRSLSEHELSSIEVALSGAGMKDWRRVGRRIEVPEELHAEYLAALNEAEALPNEFRNPEGKALDQISAFDPSGLRHSRESLAKKESIGLRISAFPDVQSASIEYDEGERRGLSRIKPQSASVMVIPEGNMPLSRNRIRDIQNLVRGSYAGLSSDDIVVIDANGAGGVAAEEDDPMLRKQREAESRIEQKVRSLLVGFPAKVAVSAEIDPTMDAEKTVLTYDPEPTNLSNKTTKIEVTNHPRQVRGVPGTATNAIGNRAASIEKTTSLAQTTEDARETTGVAGQQYENSRMASLQVKSVRVSVGLPSSYYEKIHVQDFLKKNIDKTAAAAPPMSDTDLENLRLKTKKVIQSAVTVLLPEVDAGADRFPLVEVWDYTDLPVPKVAEAQTAALALTWLSESWQTISLIGLAVIALLVARSVARGGGGNAPQAFEEGFGLDIPSPAVESHHSDEDAERMTITGGSLREELVSLVEENPEVAANVIRGWVGDAA